MIYVVEDDSGIRDMMIYTLKSTGFDAMGFADGEAFVKKIKEEKPSLIILDIMLPGTDGISLLKTLRSHRDTKEIPVIMSTAKGEEYDKISALDLGADDYLVKPFGMMEMVSRIKAVLRRCAPREEEKEIRIGNLTMNLAQHKVSVNGREITLTLKEFEMLRLFMNSPKMVFTRDMLLESVWGMNYDGETRTVDVHVRTLRDKLQECASYIETVRGVGYRMKEENS